MLPPASVGLRPWIGSAALHLVFVALIAGFAIKWRAEPPLPQLAIQGSVVRYEDLPPAVRSGKPLRESVPVPPQPPPRVETPPEPRPEAKPDPAVEQRRVAEEQARERAEQVQRQKLAEQKARDAAALAEQKRKADEAKQKEALEAKQRQQQEQATRDAKAKADREAKARADREAELKRALASEEEGEAIQRSGVVDEYRALLTQTIERNWIRPPSAKPGLECTLNVTQATGGTVLAVAIGTCNGDQAVRESITNAVYRSSPLPAPRDPRVFERRLVIVFKPSE
ncbi:MAG TPA: cell envelope integrity protein TolA [Steroidobacteraceae bacterium]